MLQALLPPRHATLAYDHLTIAYGPSRELTAALMPWVGTAAELLLGEEAHDEHAQARP